VILMFLRVLVPAHPDVPDKGPLNDYCCCFQFSSVQFSSLHS